MRTWPDDFVVSKNKSRILIKCRNCLNEFEIYQSRLNQKRGQFCSKACSLNFHSKRIIGQNNPNYKGKIKARCEICNMIFYYYPSETKFINRRTCSNRCRHKLQAKILKGNAFFKGKKHSVESRKKMSKSWSYEKSITPKRNEKISIALKGKNNPRWKGGPKTAKAMRDRLRKSREYKNWRKAVFERDNYTCQKCYSRNGNGKYIYLEAHHIKSWAEYPKLRFDISNGTTLCKQCHDLEPKGHEIHV